MLSNQSLNEHKEIQNLLIKPHLLPEDDRDLVELNIEKLANGESIVNPDVKTILNSAGFMIAYVRIPIERNLGEKNEFPSELAQLNGAVSPFTFLTDGGMNRKLKSKGKRSVLVDMLIDNLNNLPSLRGKTLYFLMQKDTSYSKKIWELPLIEKSKKDMLGALLDQDKTRQVQLLGSVLEQCYPRLYGLHWINPVSYVDWIFSRISVRIERAMFTLGALLSFPFHETRKKFNAATGIAKAGWGFLTFIATIPHVVGQIPTVVGNVFRYTRHLVSGIANVGTSVCAKIKDVLFDTDDYGKKYPPITPSLKTIGKSILYLIPAVAVLALCFVPGMQFVPALLPALAKLSLAKTIFSWIGISVGTSLAAQGISGGLRKVVIECGKNSKPVVESPAVPRPSASQDAKPTSDARISRTLGSKNQPAIVHSDTNKKQNNNNTLAPVAPAPVQSHSSEPVRDARIYPSFTGNLY